MIHLSHVKLLWNAISLLLISIFSKVGTTLNVASEVVDAYDICCMDKNSNQRDVAINVGASSHKNSFLLECQPGTFLIFQHAAGQG